MSRAPGIALARRSLPINELPSLTNGAGPLRPALDPPYHGSEDTYGEGVFGEAGFERLADLLQGIKGRFILTINASPKMREIFARFSCEEVGLNYRIGGAPTPACELVLTGP